MFINTENENIFLSKLSICIKYKVYFGSYPKLNDISLFLENNFILFVDCTTLHEELPDYYHLLPTNYIKKYPIKDHCIPTNKYSFCCFLLELYYIIKELKDNQKIYIHCKGGHGRSGLISACLLCLYYNYSPEESLFVTNLSHNIRLNLKEKWIKLGSPQTKGQKNLIIKLFYPYKFSNNGIYKNYNELSTFSDCNLEIDITSLRSSYRIDDINTISCISSVDDIYSDVINLEDTSQKNDSEIKKFNNIHNAYVYIKYRNFPDIVNKLEKIQNPCISEYIDYKINLSLLEQEEWEKIKVKVLYKLLKLKFDTYPEAKKKLLETGLKPIIFFDKYNKFLGFNDKGKYKDEGNNGLGKILMKIRNNYFINKDYI